MIGNRVFKIPSFRRWVSFIRGIEENLEERYWWSADGSRRRNPKQKWNHPYLAEIYWADRFGFLVIMERLNTDFMDDAGEVRSGMWEKVDRDLAGLSEFVKHFSFAADLKPANVGYRNDQMVILDYGYYGGTRDCYIGT